MVSPYSGCSIHFLCSRLLSMLCQPLRSSYSLIRKNLLLPSQAILRLSLQATLLLLIFRRVLSKQKLAFSLKSRNRQLFLHRHPTLALLQHRSIFNALSLPSQQLSNDIDDETILRLPDGDNIPAHEIEKNLLNALPCVSHAIVFGSNRPLLAALLVLKSSNNNDPSLPLSSEGLFLAAQFNSSATTAR